MHNLVKETTGIDLNEFGNDLKAAKEVTLRTLCDTIDYKDKTSIEASQSIGHLLSEVVLHLYLGSLPLHMYVLLEYVEFDAISLFDWIHLLSFYNFTTLQPLYGHQ